MLLAHIHDSKKREEISKIAYTLYKQSKEKLVGGKGDGQPDCKYNSAELRKGVAHEIEHIRDKAAAKEISKDHLEENPRYYSALAAAKIE
jgi:hypothetical protein